MVLFNHSIIGKILSNFKNVKQIMDKDIINI